MIFTENIDNLEFYRKATIFIIWKCKVDINIIYTLAKFSRILLYI